MTKCRPEAGGIGAGSAGPTWEANGLTAAPCRTTVGRTILAGRLMQGYRVCESTEKGRGVVERSTGLRSWLPALVASIPVAIIYFAVLGIVLTAAGPEGLHLTDARTSGWIAVGYGFPTVIALVLTLRTRQPLLLTANIFAIIFVVSLVHHFTFPELVAASILARAAVLVASTFGPTGRIAGAIPARIVYGLIAGAVMPFIVNIFTFLSTSRDGVRLPYDVPLTVGSALLAYLLSQRLFGSRVPPILPAFIIGLLVAWLTGQLGAFPTSFS